MGWNDRIDLELHQMVSDATDDGHIEEGTPAYGVAQQVIDQGYESLSDRQKWVYDHKVLPALKALQEDRDNERNRDLFERD